GAKLITIIDRPDGLHNSENPNPAAIFGYLVDILANTLGGTTCAVSPFRLKYRPTSLRAYYISRSIAPMRRILSTHPCIRHCNVPLTALTTPMYAPSCSPPAAPAFVRPTV